MIAASKVRNLKRGFRQAPQRAVIWATDLPRDRAVAIAVGSIAILIAVDIGTGPYISLNTLYLLPLCLITWRFLEPAGLATGVALAVSTMLINGFGDGLSAQATTVPALAAGWNAIMRILAVIIIVVMVGTFRRAFDRERAQARTDALTGLGNKRALFDDATKLVLLAERHKQVMLIAYCDIDHFKTINDQHGHDGGDALLQHFASTLQTLVRPYDVCARLGGDEFITVQNVRDTSAARATAERMFVELSEALARHAYPATCSIGAIIVDCPAQHGIADLIKLADRGMYSIKRRGKNSLDISLLSAATPVPAAPDILLLDQLAA